VSCCVDVGDSERGGGGSEEEAMVSSILYTGRY